MRDAYHEQLDSIERELRRMAELVGVALARATWAVLEGDLSVAESVDTTAASVCVINRAIEANVLELMARQQPVAGDLRALVATLRISAEVERMGDLAVHVAAVARMRHPRGAVPSRLRPSVEEMGRIGVRLAERLARLIMAKDVDGARQLADEDDAVDELHRAVLADMLASRDAYSIEAAIDLTLISRYYERYADHAVNAAGDLVFLVTGEPGRRKSTRRAPDGTGAGAHGYAAA